MRVIMHNPGARLLAQCRRQADLLLADHPPQQIHDRLAERAAATGGEPGKFLEKALLDTDHARIRIVRMGGA